MGERTALTSKHQALARQLVVQLHSVVRTTRLHGSENRALLIASENLKNTINTLWAALGSVRLQIVEDTAYLNDCRIRLDSGTQNSLNDLREVLDERNLGGLAISRPVDTAALKNFLVLMSREVTDKGDIELLKNSLESMKELAMELLDRRSFADDHAIEDIRVDKKTFALQTYAKTIVAAREALKLMQEGENPMTAKIPITRIIQDLVDIATERINFMLKLGAIKSADEYLVNHAANTCVLSLVIGRALDVDRVELVDLGIAGLLANLGFGLIPQDLLEQPRELSEDERKRVRSMMACTVRQWIPERRINKAAMRRALVAIEHLRPYRDPDTGQRQDLLLFSRIVAVASAYDALTTKRPWRDGYTPDEALAILQKESDSKFDPVVVKIMINLMGMYPLGSAVILDSGELGIVYHTSHDPDLFDKPWVRVVRNAQGQPVKRTDIRNLAESSDPSHRISRLARPTETQGFDPAMLACI